MSSSQAESVIRYPPKAQYRPLKTPSKREPRDAADMPWNKVKTKKSKRKVRPVKVGKKAKRVAHRKQGKRG